jgi:hypothetical protein
MSTSNSKRPLDISSAPSNGSVGWVKCYSKTYNRDYWYNEADGTKSWTEPPMKARKLEADSVKQEDVEPVLPSAKTAVIVPFRDISKDKTRTTQLRKFVPTLVSYLRSTGVPFHIYIVEQSNDKRKFNRGKLLNVGFDKAMQERCTTFVFHDVDLLPSEELKPYYVQQPIADTPVHIARVWDRYNANPNYFGGVVAFSKDMYQRINGFPNNFWGEGLPEFTRSFTPHPTVRCFSLKKVGEGRMMKCISASLRCETWLWVTGLSCINSASLHFIRWA